MIGTRLSAYEVLAELGSGGMGSVYLAECTESAAGLDAGTAVALKVIHPNLLSQPGFFKRFLREAQIGQEVQHDNVVRTYDCDATETEGKAAHFLVMEYVEGQTLRDLLKELERVPEELCRHIGREVAKGLAAIHEAGVVHRDLKPENVLITEAHVVKVMDLGVARLQDEAMRLSQAGAFVGSLEYAAPEQFRTADGEPDGRADLHALGVLLYELSTGQHPYRDEDASKVLRNILDVTPRKAGEVNPQLSPFYEEVLHDLLAKDPADRFAGADVLAQVLEDGEQGNWWQERAKALRIETKKPLRRIRIPRETALYGRDDDLAKMQALFDKAKDGDGQVLLVEGEAGIGKTRLVDEFVGRLRQSGEDINFLFGSYPPGGAATAAGAFSTAYREQFGPAGSTDYLTETPILVPAFDALLRGEPPPEGKEPLTEDSLQTVFVHATRALAAERTTVVLIDDLHFAPEDGRALFASLALAVPEHRILLIGTMRPGVPEGWTAGITRLEHAEQRSLARLGPKDLVALLKDAFRSERLANELGIRIAEKSDGNPFFAFEIIRGLREGQFISQQPDGTWVTTKVIEDIQVPSSVLDLVNARVADLTEDERDLLDVASCCGFTFDPSLVADAAGVPLIPALKRFGQIERRHRLVRTAGADCAFDHHQVQEAIYGGLIPKLREAYHAAIGDALETREKIPDRDPTDLDGALCVDLCEHFLKGARGESALRYMEAALDHLEAGYLNDQALVLVDCAFAVPGLLEDARRVGILLRKNGCLFLMGRRKEQDAVLSEARLLTEAQGEETLLAEVENATGGLLFQTGRYEEARAHLERARSLYETVGDRKGEAQATFWLGTVFWSRGRYEDADVQFERALAIDQEIGERMGEARASNGLGLVCTSTGRHEEALAYHEHALVIYEEAGHRGGEAIVTGNLGNVLHVLGRFEEARAHYERVLAILKEIGNRASEATFTVGLGSLLLQLGSTKEARPHPERALALAREVGDVRIQGYALESLGDVAEQAGDFSDARRFFERAISLRREIGYRSGLASSLASLGGLLFDQGQDDEAVPLLEEALSLAREMGIAATEVEVICLQALLPRGDAREAPDALTASEGKLGPGERMSARFLCFRATHDPTHLTEAKRLLDHLVEHAPEEYRESMLKNVRLHRDIMQAWESLDPEQAQRVEGEHGQPAGNEAEA